MSNAYKNIYFILFPTAPLSKKYQIEIIAQIVLKYCFIGLSFSRLSYRDIETKSVLRGKFYEVVHTKKK